MKKLISITAFLILFISTTWGQESGYSKTLYQMFEVSGTEETYKGAINQMLTIFKQQAPSLGEDFWKDFETEFMKTSLTELTEMLVPVYKKHLTQADLEGMIKFYSTPVGKKFAQTSPLIMQESMQIGAEWGKKIGENFQKKLKEKGY
jgi:hypothetical protein